MVARKGSGSILAVLLLQVAAAQFTVDTYPDLYATAKDRDNRVENLIAVEKNGFSCGPADLDRLCDPNSLLSSDAASSVQQTLKQIEFSEETKYDCGNVRVGFQVAFALASKVAIPRFGSKESTIEEFAKELHDRWGVGHAQCNDGVVLMLSANDRYMFFSTGAGAKKIVTDTVVDALIERMKPALRAHDVDAAVLGAATDLRDYLNPNTRENSGIGSLVRELEKEHQTNYFGIIAFILLFIGVMVASMWQERKYRRELSAWEQARARLVEIETLQRETPAVTPAPMPTPVAEVTVEGADQLDAEPPGGMDEQAHDDAAGDGDPLLKQSQAARLRRRANIAPESPEPRAAPSDTAPLAARMTCCPICLEDFPHEATAAAATTRVVRLPCQHRFHEACIDQWFGGQGRQTCPVCRTPAFRTDGSVLTEQDVAAAQRRGGDQDTPQPHRPAASAPSGSSGSCTAAAGAGAAADDDSSHTSYRSSSSTYYRARPYDSTLDLIFLLNSMNRRYPQYVTRSHVDSWTRDPTRLSSASFSTDAAFAAARPRPPSSSSGGSSRSGGSFGGGSSRGGGGRGGGW